MSDFAPAIAKLLSDEGGHYIENDHGQGPSRYGITLRSYREFYPDASEGDIAALTADSATAFYRDHRWNRYHIGMIEDQAVASKVFNMLVNMGAGSRVREPDGTLVLKDGAITLLQEAVNEKPDGILGPVTAGAVNTRDPQSLLTQYRALLVQHYEDILKTHPDWENDRAGWMARANA